MSKAAPRSPNTLAETGPHGFRPLGRFLHRHKCFHCYLPLAAHPVRGYTPSRPYGDKRATL